MFRIASVFCLLFGATHVWSQPMIKESEVSRTKRLDDPGPLQNVVDTMSQKLVALEAKVAALQNSQDTSVAALQQKIDTLETRVAFHAVSGSDHIDTVAQGTIILPRVLTNIGNAYSAQSGFFTAPVSGLYLFHAKIMNADLNDYVHAGIFVGGTQESATISDQRHGYHDNPSLFAIAYVNKGQIVQLKSLNNEVDHFQRNEHTTFSGVLIRAD